MFSFWQEYAFDTILTEKKLGTKVHYQTWFFKDTHLYTQEKNSEENADTHTQQ